MDNHESEEVPSGMTAGPSLVTLERVTDKRGIRENVRRFNQDARGNAERSLNIIRQTTYWVCDEDAGTFAPSKFVGYSRMTFDRYDRALAGQCTGATFDGGVAKETIEGVLGAYGENPSMAGSLVKWVERTFGPAALTNVDQSKWRFVSLPSDRKYWALVCNPTKYKGLEATQALDEIVWTINRSDPKPGDRIAVWQAKGDGDARGIIAVGEVIAGVKEMGCPPQEIPYFREPIPPPSPCIRFKVLRCPGIPIWEADAPWLSDLAAAKARGGTVFSLAPEQWHDIIAAAGQPVENIDRDSANSELTGQGFGLSPAARRAVEKHAQTLVEEHFAGLEYEVDDTSTGNPFDLRCTRGNETLYVEVKGTTGDGAAVFMTRNEVAYARGHAPQMVLAIVTGIELTDTIPPGARGGKLELIKPWNVDDGTLTPITFSYVPPSS